MLFSVVHAGCTMASFGYEDLDLAQTKIGYIQMTFNPYDVRLNRQFGADGILDSLQLSRLPVIPSL